MTLVLIEDIRNKIAENELDEAINLFRANCDEFANELVLQSSRYKNLKGQIRTGVISVEQSNIKRNQLCASLLELLDELDVKETAPKNATYEITPELADILGLAEAISRQKGKDRTSTRDFFTALNTLKPESLAGIIKQLNGKEALPKSADESLLSLPRKLSNSRPLSACLTESLHELGEVSAHQGATSAADMFIDVSKYGKGKSVDKLRKHGVGRVEIDDYVRKFALEVKHRKN